MQRHFECTLCGIAHLHVYSGYLHRGGAERKTSASIDQSLTQEAQPCTAVQPEGFAPRGCPLFDVLRCKTRSWALFSKDLLHLFASLFLPSRCLARAPSLAAARPLLCRLGRPRGNDDLCTPDLGPRDGLMKRMNYALGAHSERSDDEMPPT